MKKPDEARELERELAQVLGLMSKHPVMSVKRKVGKKGGIVDEKAATTTKGWLNLY